MEAALGCPNSSNRVHLSAPRRTVPWSIAVGGSVGTGGVAAVKCIELAWIHADSRCFCTVVVAVVVMVNVPFCFTVVTRGNEMDKMAEYLASLFDHRVQRLVDPPARCFMPPFCLQKAGSKTRHSQGVGLRGWGGGLHF